MTSRKKWIAIGALSVGVCFLAGWLTSFQLPKVKSWILVQIDQASREELPARIVPGSIDLHLFPLAITLEQVKIIPKEDLAPLIDPLSIEKVEADINFFQLIQGRLRFDSLMISGSKIVARVPHVEKSTEPPLKGLFRILDQIPITELELEQIALDLTLKEPPFRVMVDELSLNAEKTRSGLAVDLNAPSIFVRDLKSPASIRVDVETKLVATRRQLTVSSFRIRRGDSYIVASGNGLGDVEELKFSNLEGSARASLAADSVRNWAHKTFPELAKIPTFAGRVEAEADWQQNEKVPFTANYKFTTQNFKVDQFFLGEIHGEGNFADQVLKSPEVTVLNKALELSIKNLELDFNANKTLKGQLNIAQMNVHELMPLIEVGRIPVWMQVAGQQDCSGVFLPQFQLSCKGDMRARDAMVRDELAGKFNIVAIDRFDAAGSFTVTENDVSYVAEIEMPNSKGRSQGKIGYATGFNIDYEADRLSMTDIRSLAELKLEGEMKLRGSTSGDSNAATTTSAFEGTNLWLENYHLGNVKAQLAYADGLVSFKGAKGNYINSRYEGDITLDVRKKHVTVDARAPFIDSKDILPAFSRRVKLPMPVVTTGSMQIKLWGPLEFHRLSYDLKSSFYRGSVGPENFDVIYFDVKARDGEVTTDRVLLKKGPATATLKGVGHPDGTIKVGISGTGFRLADSTLIRNSGLAMTGILDFTMEMTDHVLSPDSNLKGQLTQTTIADQLIPDSNFNLKLKAKTIEGDLRLFGDGIQMSLVWPTDTSAPFSMKLKATEWNYTPFFFALAGPSARRDFEGRLTTDIQLKSETGGFWNATGPIVVGDFLLKRGTLDLHTQKPILANMEAGSLKIKQFDVAGENTFIKITENPNPLSKIDLQVNGKLDLNLLSILTPFLEEFRGDLSFAFNVRASPGTTDFLGSAYIDRGFVKLFDFPHPFEEIKADLLFSQKKLLMNSIKSNFAGGRLSGDGSIGFNGYRKVPLQLRVAIDKVTMNVPDKFKTSGSGHLNFSGNWFPYEMQGEYEIKEGLITKEAEGSSAAVLARRSSYLPEALVEENFSPLKMDLKITMLRPVDVKNKLMDGKVAGQVQVKGDPKDPSILGTINLEKDGKIFFHETPFDIISGVFEFTDPTAINPKMYIAARSRVQEYDVSLVIQGTPEKPDFALSSQPPLPDKEIISLLALGITNSKLDTDVNSQQKGNSTSFSLGSAILQANPLGQTLKNRFGVDMQISSGFDDTANVAVQKVTLSRAITPKFGVSAVRSIGGTKQSSEYRFKYKVNNRVSLGVGLESEEAVDAANEKSSLQRVGVDAEYKLEFK